mgnify:CR=1 FL=1|jgi:hypothetical protein
MNYIKAILSLIFLVGPLSISSAAEKVQKDVLFVVLGKTANFRQSSDETHRLLNYHFFAEIFLKENGSVSNAALITPDDNRELVFEGDDSVLEVHGGRYTNEDELNKAFPDGNYIFSYRLSDNTLLNESVRIRNGSGNSRIPDPVSVYLSQDGKKVNPANVNSDLDLTVTWSPFESGNTDPNGIVDDLMFVVTGNCHGKKIDHSGGPFGSGEYLTFASTNYVIPASKLQPGERFQIFVEQAEMDSSEYRGIPEIATYAATTFMDIETSGEKNNSRKACPKVMPAMDGGQTDRPVKK